MLLLSRGEGSCSMLSPLSRGGVLFNALPSSHEEAGCSNAFTSHEGVARSAGVVWGARRYNRPASALPENQKPAEPQGRRPSRRVPPVGVLAPKPAPPWLRGLRCGQHLPMAHA